MKRLALIAFALAFSACPTTTSTPSCATVCANMVKLDCPSAKPTAKNATCEQVCANFQNSGIAKWDLTCRTLAASCAAADACEAGK